MADGFYAHFTHPVHPQLSQGPSSLPAQNTQSRSRGAFARLTQPFIGTSRPPSSSGLPNGASNGPAPTSVPTSAPNPLTPRILRHNVNSPVLAFSANSEFDRVVVAGREILRILRVGYNEVSEHSNLRAAAGDTKRHFQYDVKWGTVNQRNTIATAGTNGTICLYDMNAGILERQLREHGRQVHKIAFNPADGRLLLSASQDGTIKLWDLRERKSRLTFVGKADAVRDVQFNANNVTEFAAGFDNGTIQRWDYRKDTIYERKISAHNGPVFSVDWHPDGKHCASGGRDRTIKVWDFYADPRMKAKHTIESMASVGRVAWRPLKHGTTEIAACAMHNDHRVHVWDLKRPYVPARTLDVHDNLTTGLMWRDEDLLWSVSKDCHFVQSDVPFAPQPLNSLSHSAISWDPNDEFTFAVQRRGKSRRGTAVSSRGALDAEEDMSLREERRRHGRSSSFKSLKPSLSSTNILDSMFEKYTPAQPGARVTAIPGLFDREAFEYFADRYIFDIRGVAGGDKMTRAEACENNARAAWRAQKFRTAQSWKILQLALVAEEAGTQRNALRQMNENGPSGPEGLLARRALGINGDHLGESHSHRSGGTTPLAGPVHESPMSVPTPIPGKYTGMEEGMLLPPAAFGTSPSSSTLSTDGGGSTPDGINRRRDSLTDSADDKGKLKIPTRPSLGLRALSNETAIKDDHTNGKRSITASVHSQEAEREAEPRRSTDDDPHLGPLFTASTERSDPLSSPTRSPKQHHTDTRTSATTSVAPNSYTPLHLLERQHSIAASDNTSSSYGFLASTRSDDDSEPPSSHADAAHVPPTLPVITEEALSNSGILKRPAASMPELRASTKPPAPLEYAPLTPEERAQRPWSPMNLINELLTYYANKGDVQFCAVLTLLFELDPMGFREQEFVEGYLMLLNRKRMFVQAAQAVKVAAGIGFDGIKEKAQMEVHVDVVCPRCERPVWGQKGGSWFCERCGEDRWREAVKESGREVGKDGARERGEDTGKEGAGAIGIAWCGVCEGIVKGRWTACGACGHGGCERCVREWFVGDGQGGDRGEGESYCFREGCGCDCLP